MTTRAVDEERARRAAVVPDEANDFSATPRAEGEASVGGALYSPFARAAAEPMRQDIQASGYREAGESHWMLGTLVMLAGVGALIYLRRRA